MIELTIDGKKVTAENGTTILEAARSAGIDIPTMCYHSKNIAPVSCFVCAVRIDGRENFVPSCATTVRDGMSVDTCSDAVRDCRRRALELMWSEHAGNCGSCEKKKTCALLGYAAQYKANRLRYAADQRKPHTHIHTHTHTQTSYDSGLVHEPGKCIVCGKCVHITKERDIKPGLSFTGRGSDIRVTAPFGIQLDIAMGEALIECVESCPTGALWIKHNI